MKEFVYDLKKVFSMRIAIVAAFLFVSIAAVVSVFAFSALAEAEATENNAKALETVQQILEQNPDIKTMGVDADIANATEESLADVSFEFNKNQGTLIVVSDGEISTVDALPTESLIGVPFILKNNVLFFDGDKYAIYAAGLGGYMYSAWNLNGEAVIPNQVQYINQDANFEATFTNALETVTFHVTGEGTLSKKNNLDDNAEEQVNEGIDYEITYPSGSIYYVERNKFFINTADNQNVNELTLNGNKIMKPGGYSDRYWFWGFFFTDNVDEEVPLIGKMDAVKNGVTCKFTDANTTCQIQGNWKPGTWVHLHFVSTNSPICLGGGETYNRFYIDVPRGVEGFVVASLGGKVGYKKIEATDTMQAIFDCGDIEDDSAKLPYCLYTGTLTWTKDVSGVHTSGTLLEAAVMYLWDDRETEYDFKNTFMYTDNMGRFYLPGERNKNGYIVYCGPGVQMSFLKVSKDQSAGAQYTVSYNIKLTEDHYSNYLYVEKDSHYNCHMNMYTADAADVLDFDLNTTVNMGLINGTKVTFNGDQISYQLNANIDPWNQSNSVLLNYKYNCQPEAGYHFKYWTVNGEIIDPDNPVVRVVDDHSIVKAVVDDEPEFIGTVTDKETASAIDGANVYFINNDGTQIISSAQTDVNGEYEMAVPPSTEGILLVVKERYKSGWEFEVTSPAEGPSTHDFQLESGDSDPIIYGKVTNYKTGKEIANAVVTEAYIDSDDNPVTKSVVTDSHGNYVFERFSKADCPDAVDIVALASGYLPHFESGDFDSPFNKLDIKLSQEENGKLANFNMHELQDHYTIDVYKTNGEKNILSYDFDYNFSLMFDGFSYEVDPDNEEVLVFTDNSGTEDYLYYKITSTPKSDEYNFEGWNIQPQNGPTPLDSDTVFSPVYNDPHLITGQVTDITSEHSVVGAKVIFVNDDFTETYKTVETDNNGYYRMEGIEVGKTGKIICLKDGYEPWLMEKFTKADYTDIINIGLHMGPTNQLYLYGCVYDASASSNVVPGLISDAYVGYYYKDGSYKITTKTDDNGYYLLRVPNYGNAHLFSIADGYLPYLDSVTFEGYFTYKAIGLYKTEDAVEAQYLMGDGQKAFNVEMYVRGYDEPLTSIDVDKTFSLLYKDYQYSQGENPQTIVFEDRTGIEDIIMNVSAVWDDQEYTFESWNINTAESNEITTEIETTNLDKDTSFQPVFKQVEHFIPATGDVAIFILLAIFALAFSSVLMYKNRARLIMLADKYIIKK